MKTNELYYFIFSVKISREKDNKTDYSLSLSIEQHTTVNRLPSVPNFPQCLFFSFFHHPSLFLFKSFKIFFFLIPHFSYSGQVMYCHHLVFFVVVCLCITSSSFSQKLMPGTNGIKQTWQKCSLHCFKTLFVIFISFQNSPLEAGQ